MSASARATSAKTITSTTDRIAGQRIGGLLRGG
jgi:hypothetical protein